jgi:hypothetical protein
MTRLVNRGPVFVIKLRPVRSDSNSNLRGLRWILKSLLRRHVFRCIDAREQQEIHHHQTTGG